MRGMEDLIVARVDKARALLALASGPGEAKKIADMARAAEVYARRQRLSEEAIGYAVAVKVDAMTLLGEFLEGAEKNKGACGSRVTGTKREPVKDTRATLAEVGVTKRESSESQKLARMKREAPEKHAAVREGKVSVREAETEARREQESEKERKERAKVAGMDVSDVCEVRCCSCGELFVSGVRPDCVVTDPPYPREFLPVYSEFGKACVGVPLVAVMVGQTYLPEVLKRLCEHLEYRWMMAYMTPGAAMKQWQRKVDSMWKPVLVFGRCDETIFDVVRSERADKEHHEWGQSESGMADLVERLTKPGQLVCDPFCGGGTTAVVSVRLGRRFIGCDIDAAAVKETVARVQLCRSGV